VSVYFATNRWIFNCREEGKRLSCLKFSIDGQFFRVVSLYKINQEVYIVDDNKVNFHSNDTLMEVAKRYIEERYGKIENVITRE